MKVRVTRGTGLMPGSIETLLFAEGITQIERENPESDSTVIATMTADQLHAMRNRYYQPHKLEVIEPDPPPAPPEKLYTKAELEEQVKIAYDAGYFAACAARGRAKT